MYRATDWFIFACVVFIWSTTPLAIVMSNQAVDPYLSLAARMVISLLFLGSWFAYQRRPLPFYKQALPTHLPVGVLGLGLSMPFVYFAAQTLPSNWIALIFGLTPLFTGLIEGLFFRALHLSFWHWIGLGLAFYGIWLIFHDPQQGILINNLLLPIMAMLCATFLHALSASLVKRIKHKIPPVDTVMGGLLVATPISFLFWWLNGAQTPTNIEINTQISIIYLGIIGSLAGFLLYYQLLKTFSATMTSFITLLAPSLALLWGVLLNHEPITVYLISGAALILMGLAVFIFIPADKN
jgi:drug/metabolite transporter (DMT)-like permease